MLDSIRKSSISDIKNADIKEIADIKIDKTQAGKTVEEIEETDFVSIYPYLGMIYRSSTEDYMAMLNDIIFSRWELEYFLNICYMVKRQQIWISTE